MFYNYEPTYTNKDGYGFKNLGSRSSIVFICKLCSFFPYILQQFTSWKFESLIIRACNCCLVLQAWTFWARILVWFIAYGVHLILQNISTWFTFISTLSTICDWVSPSEVQIGSDNGRFPIINNLIILQLTKLTFELYIWNWELPLAWSRTVVLLQFGLWLDVKIFNLGLSKTPLLQPAHACEFHQPIKDKSAQTGPGKHLCTKRCSISSHSSVWKQNLHMGPQILICSCPSQTH
jgi:hypothetical protein